MSEIKQWAIFRDGAEGVLYIREIGAKFSEREVAVCYSTPIEDVELLAAAPELLKSLKEFVALANFDADTIPKTTEEWDAMVARAETVIRKAEPTSISQEAKQ